MNDVTVQRSVVLDVSPEEAWLLITDPTELAAWLGAPTEAGGHLALTELDGTTRRLVVDEVDPGHRLGFTWWPAADPDAASHVTLTVTADGDRTTLTVEETPVARAGGGQCSIVDAGAAWDERLVDLELRCLAGTGALAAT
jgi:uncharacterized protein YndB with AHSA1/START domain